jgi:hypothetical protein
MSAPAPTSTTASPVNDAATETSPEASPPQTFLQKLKAGEEHGLWKLGLRAFTVIAAIIGVGCMAWALSTPARGDYVWEMDDPWSLLATVITFGITAIWCTICVLIVLLRSTHRPVHPGVAVGIDLVLWLAYIISAMFATYAVVNLYSFGSGGYINNEYSSSGYYVQASNGTWIYNQTDYDSSSYYGSERDCNRSSRYYQEYNNGFSDCAEEDAYVNQLWNDRSHRIGVETTGLVCQYLCLILHLALFIWACVDTNRRNRGKVSKDAEKLAANIVMNMVRSGAIVPTQNGMQHPLLQPQSAHMQGPQMGGWPLAGPAPMGQSPVHMMPPQAMTRPEKGESSRFA